MPTTKQTRTLRGLAARHLYDDQEYRDWLRATFPEKEWTDPDRPSTLDLTTQEASKAISTLLKYDRSRPSEDTPDLPDWRGYYTARGSTQQGKHLTQKQADEIARLEHKLGWLGEEKRIRGFILRTVGKAKFVAALTKREATHVITALRKMAASAA